MGTLRVKRYEVIVFDPVNRTHEELRHLLRKYLAQLDQEQEALRPELIVDMMKPIARHTGRFKRSIRNQSKKKAKSSTRPTT